MLGLRSAARLGLLTIGLLLGIGLASATPGPSTESYHTQAFDHQGRMAIAAGGLGATASALADLPRRADPAEQIAFGSLAAIGLLGVEMRRASVRDRIDRWLDSPAPDRPGVDGSFWERPIPKGWLACSGTLGAITALAVLLLIAFPDPEPLFEDVAVVQVETHHALLLGDDVEALNHVDRSRSLAEKLGSGVLLRRGRYDDRVRRSGEELIDSLEMLRDFVSGGRNAEARACMAFVTESFRDARSAHLGD